MLASKVSCLTTRFVYIMIFHIFEALLSERKCENVGQVAGDVAKWSASSICAGEMVTAIDKKPEVFWVRMN